MMSKIAAGDTAKSSVRHGLWPKKYINGERWVYIREHPRGAGVKTGLIRAMAGSGNVVVTAAFVLAGTMLALLSSDVVNIGQAGSTIAIGLVFDMLIVRLFLVMPLARLLGPWFWWPQRVRSRPQLAL
jgi:uncharacterized membrane protein YdfJ with MMPL/SSD domain